MLKAKDVPQIQEALLALSPHFVTFFNAFEDGADQAKGFFERIQADCDLHLHAHIVRFSAKRYLNQHGLRAEYEAEDLLNSGIQLSIAKWFLRIRKSDKGAVPGPGRSEKLKDYYKQVLSKEFADMHNLLLLWHATPKGDFKGLSLVYPLSAYTDRWRVEIPYPAVSAHEKSTFTYQTSFDESGNVEDFGDLEIEPLQQEEEDNEAENL